MGPATEPTANNPSGAPAIDFSHVDVGNLTTEVMTNIDETELDQYLPLLNANVSAVHYPGGHVVEAGVNNSPVNAMYAWSNKFFTSHQNSSKSAKQSDSFVEFEAHPGLYNRNGEHQQLTPFDHCVHPSYQNYAFSNHNYGTNFLQWHYS